MKELIEKQAVIDALLSKMDTIDDKPDVVLGMAIAAGMIKDMPSVLEQEPCTDAISRSAVIDTLTKTSGIRGDALKALYDLPPVTPQPKMGAWEWLSYEGIDEGNWHCSECNRIVCGAITAVNPVYSYKYCPQCGCKMQEVDE